MVGDDVQPRGRASRSRRFEAHLASARVRHLIRAKAPPPALVALDLRGNVALEGCSEAVAKALLEHAEERKPAVEELWFPINDQQEGSGAVDLVQQLEYAEVMGHDEL